MGDLVRVRAGYARNFLLPQKKALRATKENLDSFSTLRKKIEAENLEKREEAESLAKHFAQAQPVLTRQAGDNHQLYGSVTSRDIVDALDSLGFAVRRQQVALERPIKSLGLHPVRLQLHPEVSVEIRVNVARSLEEAEMQALKVAPATNDKPVEEAGASPTTDRKAGETEESAKNTQEADESTTNTQEAKNTQEADKSTTKAKNERV